MQTQHAGTIYGGNEESRYFMHVVNAREKSNGSVRLLVCLG